MPYARFPSAFGVGGVQLFSDGCAVAVVHPPSLVTLPCGGTIVAQCICMSRCPHMEDDTCGAAPAFVRGDPLLMGCVEHSTSGQLELFFQNEQHLEKSYQKKLEESVLAHASILVEGGPLVFEPKYANSPENPTRRLVNRLQRRAMKHLPGLAWVILDDIACLRVQVHLAYLPSFRQWLQVKGGR